MDVWGAINDTLSIIAWPAVAAVALVLFRGQIRNLISRVVEAELLGAKVKAREVERVTSEFGHRARDVVERAEESGELTSGERDDAQQSEETTPSVEARLDGTLPALKGRFTATVGPTFTRSQVEEFIKAAGVAGYEIGVIRMFQRPVEPVIKWSKDDVPEIDYWQSTSAPPPSAGYDPAERASRLEQEIMAMVLKQNRSDAARLEMAMTGEDGVLKELKRQLREIDPNSPWDQ